MRGEQQDRARRKGSLTECGKAPHPTTYGYLLRPLHGRFTGFPCDHAIPRWVNLSPRPLSSKQGEGSQSARVRELCRHPFPLGGCCSLPQNKRLHDHSIPNGLILRDSVASTAS